MARRLAGAKERVEPTELPNEAVERRSAPSKEEARPRKSRRVGEAESVGSSESEVEPLDTGDAPGGPEPQSPGGATSDSEPIASDFDGLMGTPPPERGATSDFAVRRRQRYAGKERRAVVRSLRRWFEIEYPSNAGHQEKMEDTFTSRSGKRAILAKLISVFERERPGAIRVSRKASVREHASEESGSATKSWHELVQQFGEEGAELRATCYDSYPDRALSRRGIDCSSREKRWYVVPFLKHVERRSCERSLQNESSTGGPGGQAGSALLASGAIEMEALGHFEGAFAVEAQLRCIEGQAERGELEPRAFESKARAASTSKRSERPSQDMKKELRRAVKKHWTVGYKLLERRAKFERKDAALWGGIVKRISSAVKEFGELQVRGKARSAGQDEHHAIVEHTRAMEDVLAEVS